MAAPNLAARSIAFVNKVGTDDPGYNTVGAPNSYLSIATALAALANDYPVATVAAPHLISVGPGVYTTPAFALPANTYIEADPDGRTNGPVVISLTGNVTLAANWSANTTFVGGIGNVIFRAGSGAPIIDLTMPTPVAGNPSRTLEIENLRTNLTVFDWVATSSADVLTVNGLTQDGTATDSILLVGGNFLLNGVISAASVTIRDSASRSTTGQIYGLNITAATSGLTAASLSGQSVTVRMGNSDIRNLTLNLVGVGTLALSADAVSIPLAANITYSGSATTNNLIRTTDSGAVAGGPQSVSEFVTGLAIAAQYVASNASSTARRVNVVRIGDSTGGNVFCNPPQLSLFEGYGFGGVQNCLGLYDCVDVTLSGISAVTDRTKWMLPYFSFAAAATVEFYPNVFTFPQQPNSGFALYHFSPQLLSGVRVIWIKGAGSFKIQYSAYAVYGDTAWTTPTWIDAITVDTSTGPTPVGITNVTFPSQGMYRTRLLQTAGTPLVANWGLLGVNGLNVDQSVEQGGDSIGNYATTPEAVWAAYLAAAAPDLITFQFKNNAGVTVAQWEASLRTILGYIRSYAPAATVLLVGNYNSQGDDTPGGTAMTMPQQRALLQTISQEPDTIAKSYLNAGAVIGGPNQTWAFANAAGVMSDNTHANISGMGAISATAGELLGMFSPLDASQQPAGGRLSGITPGTYTSLTVDARGRATAGTNPAPTPNYYTKSVVLDVSGGGTYTLTLTSADDGAIYFITTGTTNVVIPFPNTNLRDGYTVTIFKVDTGAGYISQQFAAPFVALARYKGDGLIGTKYLTSQVIWQNVNGCFSDGTGQQSRLSIVAGVPTATGAAGWLVYDSTNKILYLTTAGGSGTTTYAKMATIATATAALDFPSIGAGASADLTIAVPTAVVGQSVALALPAAPAAGIVWNAFVSAAAVVTIRASNITLVAVDPASATYGVTVFVP